MQEVRNMKHYSGPGQRANVIEGLGHVLVAALYSVAMTIYAKSCLVLTSNSTIVELSDHLFLPAPSYKISCTSELTISCCERETCKTQDATAALPFPA
jgi:hypothetical protein